jgi:hypothetical protein
MPGSFDWSALRCEKDGEVIVAPCIAFTMWFRATESAMLLDFYERALDALGPALTHYRAESMKQPAPITPRARTMVPTWLRKPAALKFYFARFQGAEDVHGASLEIYFQDTPRLSPAQQERYRRNLPALVEQGFVVNGLPTSTFRVTLPVDHPLAAPDRLARWALEFQAAKAGEFVTGGCDYSLNYDDGVWAAARQQARAACLRHPGLDYWAFPMHLWLHRYQPQAQEVLPLVKRAGWITLANERSVAYLGGEAKLAEALRGDPSVRLHRLAHGLAIQSGEGPRLGDLSRLDVPYRAVAAAIRPVRIDRVGAAGQEDEWMTEWLGMLDRPPPGEGR